MCLARRYGWTDMDLSPYRSGHDLDLRPNFQVDLSRSIHSSFHTSGREEHDAGKGKFVQILRRKLSPKTGFRKYRPFWQFLRPLQVKPLTGKPLTARGMISLSAFIQIICLHRIGPSVYRGPPPLSLPTVGGDAVGSLFCTVS